MDFRLAVTGCAWVLALTATPALAQPPAPPRADAADPAARVPAPAYSSAFSGYRGWRDEPPLGWRETNDAVGRIGGHLGMFGGAATTTAPSAPAAAAAQPAAQHHHGHGGMK